MKTWAIAGLSLVAVACGGNAESEPAKSPDGDTIKITGATPAQIRLGRFISPDGKHAIVLDRTGEKAKLQVEGSKDVVELTEIESRQHGELEGYDFFDPDGKKRISISKSGGLSFYDKGDEHQMNYDKGASALGRANIAGAPKKEEAPWKAQSTELKGKSIVVKLPELKDADASDLKKVELAFAKADAGSFVKYVETNKEGFLPHLDVAAQNVNGPGFGRNDWKTDETELAKHKKLAAYGAIIQGYSAAQSQGNHIIAELKDARPVLQSGTPGLVWSVDDNSVTVVTFDGGRYVVDLASDRDKGPKLVAGLGPDSAWPKPVQDAFVDYTDVGRLAKVGGAPQSAVDELSKIDDQWNQCAQTTWKPANAKIEIGKLTKVYEKAFSVKTQAACRKFIDQFETSLVTFNDVRRAQRTALFDKAKARAIQLGLNK